MEAALLLPVVMFVVAFLLQPAFLLYTKAVMGQAATETLRVLSTARDGGESAYVAFARRRLEAVPDIELFHVGGNGSWKVEVDGAGSSSPSVSIEGRARILPLLGVVADVLGDVEGDEVVLRTSVTQECAPAWLTGSYSDWISIWG